MHIALLYGLVVAVSNIVGVVLPIPSSLQSLSMQDYARLVETYQAYIPFIMIIILQNITMAYQSHRF